MCLTEWFAECNQNRKRLMPKRTKVIPKLVNKIPNDNNNSIMNNKLINEKCLVYINSVDVRIPTAIPIPAIVTGAITTNDKIEIKLQITLNI